MFSRFSSFFLLVGLMCSVEYGHTAGLLSSSFCTNTNPCMNGGICRDSGASYSCFCTSLCTGDHCEFCRVEGSVTGPSFDLGVCSQNPCQRDCICHESCQHAGGYYCRSASGYLGKNCTIPVPSLRCEPGQIVFSVAESFVKEYDLGLSNSYISVTRRLGGGVNCEVSRAVNGMYEIHIPLPFTACGMEGTSLNGVMVFTNQMWFNRRLANSMFDMPIPVAEFQCSYEKQYRLVTSLRPVVSTPNVIADRQFITPTISLCKTPSCPAACPLTMTVDGGAVYTVGEMIHVSMVLDAGAQVTGVEEMYLSCSASPSATSGVVDIVRKGCGSTSGLPCRIRSSAVSKTVCVSFQTPRSLGCQEFYIHAELQSCSEQNVAVCADGSGSKRCRISRKKRNLEQPAVVGLGPILLINGSSGLPFVKVHGMEGEGLSLANQSPLERLLEKGDLEEPAATTSTIPPKQFLSTSNLVIISALVVLVIMFTLLLFYLRSRVHV